MREALELNIKGIKCDKCDYMNEDVKFEDYESWLNKPCPKCGANLLTQEDLESTKALINLTNLVNRILPKAPSDEKRVTMDVEMNGTGEMHLKLKDSN